MQGSFKRLGVAMAIGLMMNGAAQAGDFGDEPRDAQLHMMTLRYEFGAGQQNFLANGVRLTQTPQEKALHAQDSGGSNAGLVVLAVGVGIAAIVLAGGHAAHENNPAAP